MSVIVLTVTSSRLRGETIGDLGNKSCILGLSFPRLLYLSSPQVVGYWGVNGDPAITPGRHMSESWSTLCNLSVTIPPRLIFVVYVVIVLPLPYLLKLETRMHV